MIGTGVTCPCTRSPDEGSVSIMPIALPVLLRASLPHAADHRVGSIRTARVSHVHRAAQPRRLVAIPGAGARFKSP